jgi:hypothetical protein
MKLLHAPKVKLEAKSPKKIKLAQAMGAKVATNINGAKVNQGLKMIRKIWQTKSCWSRR